MKAIEQIKYPINLEMELFEDKFKESMLTKVPLLNRITYYIVKRKGKQMRIDHSLQMAPPRFQCSINHSLQMGPSPFTCF